MYQAINGWTKASMKAAIRANNNGTQSTLDGGTCAYLASNGNRCFIGAFLSEDDAEVLREYAGVISRLLYDFPGLCSQLPLGVAGLIEFQGLHDGSDLKTGYHKLAEDWIDQNVIDPDDRCPHCGSERVYLIDTLSIRCRDCGYCD